MAASDRIETITTEALVDELRDVLKRSKFEVHLKRRNATSNRLVKEYLSYTKVVEPEIMAKTTIRDIDDVKVLEAALGGKVKYIISGDDDVLSLGKLRDKIVIVDVRTFLDKMQIS